MPYAANPIDQVRTFFDDLGGGGQPVLVYPGFTDPLEYAKASPLVQALKDDFRIICADHRGQGLSDKPYEVASYALTTRSPTPWPSWTYLVSNEPTTSASRGALVSDSRSASMHPNV